MVSGCATRCSAFDMAAGPTVGGGDSSRRFGVAKVGLASTDIAAVLRSSM